MSISVETYRIRIGRFDPNKLRKMKCSNYVRKCKINVTILLVFCILVSQLSTNNQPLSRNRCSINVSKLKIKSEDMSQSRCKTIQWGQSSCAGMAGGYYYSWAQSGISTNKLQKIINGNRRAVGYRLAVWNCGRGLVQEGFSTKLHEVKHFLQSKKPHCFGVIESDLFNHQCQINRAKYSTTELKEILKVDGYKI